MSRSRALSSFSFRTGTLRLSAVALALCAVGLVRPVVAGPQEGVVRAGSASITSSGAATRIDQTSNRAVIDWRGFSIGSGESVRFVQPSATSATLNRVTGDQVSVLLGRMDANGQVLLINPNGIVIGNGARIDVGGLIATTSNIGNDNFMAGRLVFEQGGRAGAGIVNAGSITAAEGGLVALVAPHVRNDGTIVARLGKVALGAADTFTIDLYGDQLVNLALSDAHVGALHAPDGKPVTSLIAQNGSITAGSAVLVTAATARAVLDNLINMNGVVRASSAVQDGGRIVLLGEGGKLAVNGTLDASGAGAGATGGQVEVRGASIALGGNARLAADGDAGGGSVRVGGDFLGGSGVRAQDLTVASGGLFTANAGSSGNGGEVVLWSDGHTGFAGTVEARGGALAGNGGRMEVSGKGTLDFQGMADASAANGLAGSLLLDPTNLDIGATEAGLISRVLRSGTSTSLQADNDINLNAVIDGRDFRNISGAGLTVTAGNAVHINDFLITNNGAVTLTAGAGGVSVAAGKAVYSGSAPITVSAAGTIGTGLLLTSGALTLGSTAGSILLDGYIDAATGPVNAIAGVDIIVSQPIASMAKGNALNLSATRDIQVNAQIDGRGGVAGGALNLTAGRDVLVNESLVANDGAVTLTAGTGGVSVAAGKAIYSGSAPIAVSAAGTIDTGLLLTTGALTLGSTAGSILFNGALDATGPVNATAGVDIIVNQPIASMSNGNALNLSATRDIQVNAQIDGRGGVTGGALSLTAGRDVHVNDFLITNDGAVTLTAGTGGASVAAGKAVSSGSGPITVSAAGTIDTGLLLTTGALTLGSTAGSILFNGALDATGPVNATAGVDIIVNQPIASMSNGNALNLSATRDIQVNAQIDGRGGVTGGALSLTAGRDVLVNDFLITNNGAVTLTAVAGGASVAAGKAVSSGSGPITVSAAGTIDTGLLLTTGALTLGSTAGSILFNGYLDAATGPVNATAGVDIVVNQPIASMAKGNALNLSATRDIQVNAQIDGRGGVTGGALNLTAGRDVLVNQSLVANQASLTVTAGGNLTVAGGKAASAGNGAINMTAAGNVTSGNLLTSGAINVRATSGALDFGGNAIDGTSGAVTLNAGTDLTISQPVVNALAPLVAIAGGNIVVNAQIDGRDADLVAAGGAVTMTAGNGITLNQSIVAENAPVTLTATAGTLTAATGKGVFTGSGNIGLTTGASITTPALVTTGNVSVASTAGSVTLNTAFTDPAAVANALSFTAATDVNLNQAIANTRSTGTLTVSAGHDINVNALIDGRDANAASPGGAVSLTAGNNLNVNQSITTENAALGLTATAGTVTVASGKGLFAGNGALNVTAGGTLAVPTLLTTGAVNLRSTGGGVNVSSALSDTLGPVTLNAATTVNISQPITSIKSGNNLVVNAGTDINVNAQIDGRGGAGSSGTISLTSGNNLNVNEHITSNNAVVNLTTTTGSVVLAAGKQVRSGSETLNITSGGDFSTGALPPPIPDATAPFATEGDRYAYVSNYLKPYVQLVTTGTLNATSTDGTLTVNAPIPETTGAVNLAGKTIVVNQHVNSNHQPITLNAGSGGVQVNAVDDSCGILGNCYDAAAIDARGADLTINSVGNVALASQEIATYKTLNIDTRGTLTGDIGFSLKNLATQATGVPERVFLNADGGMVFNAALFGIQEVTASAIGGSINLGVASPGKLRVTTGTPGTLDCPTCDITLPGGYIGQDAVLNAGGSVFLPGGVIGGDLSATARSGDVNMAGSLDLGKFTIAAGRDVKFGNASNSVVWIDGGNFSVNAGRDILLTANSGVHVGGSRSLTLNAGRNLVSYIIETRGPVTMGATSGTITANNPLGPIIPGFDDAPHTGIASLNMSAGGNITMTGAYAVGNINITTAGTLTSSREITSTAGTVAINATSASVAAVPIGTQDALLRPGAIAPVAPPGPLVPPPDAPGVASVLTPGLPGFPAIDVVGLPDGSLGSVGLPGDASGSSVALPGDASGSGVTLPGGASGSVLPGGASGSSAALPGVTGDEGNADSSAAQRAAQANDTGGDDTDGAVLSADASEMIFVGSQKGLSKVDCGPGVASGTAVRVRNAAGQTVIAICR